MNEYVQFLLFRPEVYEDHTRKFIAFVSDKSKSTVSDQARAAYRAIEDIATTLEGEILIANVASRASSSVQQELPAKTSSTLSSQLVDAKNTEHLLVKQQLEKLLQDPHVSGWIKQVMPELLKLNPIEAQAEVEYLLEIIRWRTGQYFGPDAPHRWV
ncbi:MAG: hypothetical protein ACREX3_04365 [Gammaproteobacteria bacterium]